MAVSSIAQYAGQAQATDAYNANAAAAHRDAGYAASMKYGDLERKYAYDSKAVNQEGYRAALKQREEQATLTASAGSSGIAGGSLTLDNLIAQSRQIGAENQAKVANKRDDLTDSFVSQTHSAEAEAKQRISATPFKEGPNPLGLAINLAGSAVMGAAGAQGYDVNKMTFSQLFGKA
jgi:hypothetical protein